MTAFAADVAGVRGAALTGETTSVAAADDAAVLARIARGDRHALSVLHDRYGRPLFGYLLRLAGDRGTAEELLQDTLVAVWRGAATYQARASVRSWLFGVARGQAHNRLRRKRLAVVPLDSVGEPQQAEPSPEELAIAHAEHDRLRAALARLSDVHREVLTLFFIADLSHAEVATALGVPTGTVKSRLSNGRKALARELAAPQEPRR